MFARYPARRDLSIGFLPKPRWAWMAGVFLLFCFALVQNPAAAQTEQPAPLLDKNRQPFPPAPVVKDGPLSPEVQRALAQAAADWKDYRFPQAAVRALGASGDPRMAWYLFDVLRFAGRGSQLEVVRAFEQLTGAALPPNPHTAMGDRLLAWNLPAPPGYQAMKRDLYLQIEPRWAPLFADAESTVDWRHVGWGGVYIDDRPNTTAGQPCPRGCIPALDQPKVTPASEGDWYPADAVVFGVVVNGKARAYPKHMMEIHEMVNDTLGARQLGIPYCTLCLSAQAYFTDRVSGFAPLLRTSGLLSRSNKLMYDLRSGSVIDTFTGKALSGPMRKAGVTLGGRDAQGPIFPVGDVDPRQPVHEVELGVTGPGGQALAFPRAAVQLALAAGEPVRLGGVEVRNEAGGLRAFAGGQELTAQQSFWFAWSQFKPGTLLWQR